MDKTLPQEPAQTQADIFDEIGMALEDLIGMVGPEDTLFALQEALAIAEETMGEGQQAQTPPAGEEMPGNGLNAMLRPQ